MAPIRPGASKRNSSAPSGSSSKRTKTGPASGGSNTSANLKKQLEKLEKILYTQQDEHYQSIKLISEPPVFQDWETEDGYEIIDWREEANAIIKDAGRFVNIIELSDINQQQQDDERKLQIYMNLETREKNRYTVCLNASGLRICSDRFNYDAMITGDANEPNSNLEIYETIYALLNNKSPAYPGEFISALGEKLRDTDPPVQTDYEK